MPVETGSQRELLEGVIALLRARMPDYWTVEKTSMGGDKEERDLLIKGPQGGAQTSILVEARASFSPQDVQPLGAGLTRRLRDQSGTPILLVAPFLSARTRELLAKEQINYADLTGNVRIALRYQPFFIEFQGAQKDPAGSTRSRSIRGAKAGAVVRVLIDFKPPYRGTDVARIADVNEGYASRIFDTLEDDGFITRPRPGPITDVDWPALIRRRSAALTLFKQVGSFRYVAREGLRQVLAQLEGLENENSFAITGSFAAERLAPVAAPAMLVAYSMEPRKLAASLGLMEVEAGADVILVRPDNRVVFQRADRQGGLLWAAPSQIAIDCLSGGGRMPAEGEALIEWMEANEDAWRAIALPDVKPDD